MCCNKRLTQNHQSLAKLAAKAALPKIQSCVHDAHQVVDHDNVTKGNIDAKTFPSPEKAMPTEDTTEIAPPPLTPPPSYAKATGHDEKNSSNATIKDEADTDFFSSTNGSTTSILTALASKPPTLPSPHKPETATIRVQLEGRGIPRLLRALNRPTSPSCGSCCSSNYDEQSTLLVQIPAPSTLTYQSFLAALAAAILEHVGGQPTGADKELRRYKERWIARRAQDAKERLCAAAIVEVGVEWEGVATRRGGGCCGAKRARRAAACEVGGELVLKEESWNRARDMLARRGWTDVLVVSLEEE